MSPGGSGSSGVSQQQGREKRGVARGFTDFEILKGFSFKRLGSQRKCF